MAAGQAVGGQGFGEHIGARAGQQILQLAVGQSGPQGGAQGEQQRAPLAEDGQHQDQHGGQDQLGTEIAHAGDDHGNQVEPALAMLLHQRHQAFVEGAQVVPAEQQGQQPGQAEGAADQGGAGALAPGTMGDDRHQHRDAAEDDAGLLPEAFRQG